MPAFKGTQFIRCPQCLVSRDEFHVSSQTGSGKFAKHCNMCLGKTSTGSPVHDHCLLCGTKTDTDAAMLSHYKHRHGIKIKQRYTALDILHEQRPESFPNFDLHQGYGLLLSNQDVLREENDGQVYLFARRYRETPTLIKYDIRDIQDDYRSAFIDLFDCHPISLHGHVSDTLNPELLGGLFIHLQASSSISAPRLAVMEGSYGVGYGSLAYNAVVPGLRTAACGPQPFLITMSADPQSVMEQIKAAKTEGCMAIVVEMVRSSDGRKMYEPVWQAIVQACRQTGMFLIVDEALTAIRCGAPFAHQLPEYRRHGPPDLVVFGKGIRTCGIAVDWHGVNIEELGVTDFEQQIDILLQWQARFTELAPVESLLQSWGTMVAAKMQDWPRRAVDIGVALREVLDHFQIDPSWISGLHALIWVKKDERLSREMMVMPAGTGSEWVRWLPVMDPIMASSDPLMITTFGQGSASYRRQFGAFLKKRGWMLGVCSVCGEAMETGDDRGGSRQPCMVCLARPCEQCEPGKHICQFRER
ncbi:MAG: hypothetical protein Q9170_006552 [Blastenia crenularia]